MAQLTGLAAIKTGVAAGKQLRNLSKEIAGFFDATDGAKKAHAKKRTASLPVRTKRPRQRRHRHRMQRQLKLNCVIYRPYKSVLCLSGAADDTP